MLLLSLLSRAKVIGIAAIALLILALSFLTRSQATDGLATEHEDNVPYRLLLELLQPVRLLSEDPQLVVGSELPALLIEIPIPQSGQLQWSLINHPRDFTHLFEIPKSRDQAEAVYLEQLKASGWQRWSLEALYPGMVQQSDETDLESGVILHSDVSTTIVVVTGTNEDGSSERITEPFIFCNQNSNANIILGFQEISPKKTKLQIKARELLFPCNAHQRRFRERIPKIVLAPPISTHVTSISSGSSDRGSEELVKIQTSLPLSRVADHYATQMRQQGWALQASNGDELLQWSIWTRTDDSGSAQQGIIYLFATEQPNQYLGEFKARKSPESFDLFANPPSPQPGTLPKATALQILRDSWQIPDSEPYELWLGQLPSVMSAVVSVPTEVAILGGTSRTDTGVAILETYLPFKTVQTFYRNSFTEAGWHIPEDRSAPDNAVFEASVFPTGFSEVFCNEEEGKQITLNLRPRQNSLMKVQLTLSRSGEYSPCRVEPDDYLLENPDAPETAPFPYLPAPPETSLLIGGGVYGGSDFSSMAYLQSKLTIEALTNHYTEQLCQAGWTQRTVTTSDGSFASLWRFENDAGNVWQGMLSLIAQPEPGQWAGYFSARRENSVNQ